MEEQNNGRIDREKAAVMRRNFGKWLSRLTQHRPIKYANNAWFEIEKLRSFLNDAEAHAEANGKGLSGIRIYLASYDDNDGEKVTVFLSPTEADKKEKTMQAISLSDPENDSDLSDFGVLNYGASGFPPEKDYPFSRQ